MDGRARANASARFGSRWFNASASAAAEASFELGLPEYSLVDYLDEVDRTHNQGVTTREALARLVERRARAGAGGTRRRPYPALPSGFEGFNPNFRVNRLDLEDTSSGGPWLLPASDRRMSYAIRAPFPGGAHRSSSSRRKLSRSAYSRPKPSVPRKVPRAWPPEVLRVSLPTVTQLEIKQSVNSDNLATSCFTLGTAVNRSQWLTSWASSTTSSAATAGSACTPRGWTEYNSLYNNYRTLKVVHYVKFWINNVANDSHVQVFMVKTSENNRSQPFALDKSAARDTGHWDDPDTLVKNLRAYRGTYKKEMFNQSGGNSGAIYFKSQPFIYRDRFGQKIIGGKFNTDGSGVGTSTSFSTSSTTLGAGLDGHDHFILVSSDLGSNISVPDIFVEIKTMHTLEFYNREERAAVQSGAIQEAVE